MMLFSVSNAKKQWNNIQVLSQTHHFLKENPEDSYIFVKENKLDFRLLSHYTKLGWIN